MEGTLAEVEMAIRNAYLRTTLGYFARRDITDNDSDYLYDKLTPQPEVSDAEVPLDVEVALEPPVESELRKSTRERHPSQKYSPHEPDIAHAIGVVSQFLSNPGKEHSQAVKWILRYLTGTSRVCLCFGSGQLGLDGFTDANMTGDLNSRKSTSDYMITFVGGAVSWQS
nr:uncharacterized protein LOC112763932 [Arachis hypogaea]